MLSFKRISVCKFFLFFSQKNAFFGSQQSLFKLFRSTKTTSNFTFSQLDDVLAWIPKTKKRWGTVEKYSWLLSMIIT